MEEVAAQLRSQGYNVVIQPSTGALPDFLLGHRPDMIARRDDENLVIEVKATSSTSVLGRYQELAQKVEAEPGWRFSVVVAPPATDFPPAIDTLPDERQLSERITAAERLAIDGPPDAAFLYLWSTLEAELRLLADKARLPLAALPPSMLIRELFSAGELRRDHYETAIGLVRSRNSLMHGFAAMPGEIQVQSLLELVRAIRRELEHPTT